MLLLLLYHAAAWLAVGQLLSSKYCGCCYPEAKEKPLKAWLSLEIGIFKISTYLKKN